MNRSIRAWLLGLAALVAATAARSQGVTPPPDSGVQYVVAYYEVSPDTARRAAAALERYRDAAKREAGHVGTRLFQELGRPERLMLTQSWSDRPAWERHAAGQARTSLQTALASIQVAPADVRTHRAFSASTTARPSGSGAVHVMTHLDVAPPAFAALQAALPDYVAAARAGRGLLSFEILQHTPPRQNHLTVLETWRDAAALDAHRRATATIRFRERIAPLLGSLYDDRGYRELD